MVTSNLSIARMCEDSQISSKLNMWAGALKLLLLLIALAQLGVALYYFSQNPVSGFMGIATSVLTGAVAMFVSPLLKGFAIIVEASTMIVLEHKEAEYYNKEAKIADIYSDREMSRMDASQPDAPRQKTPVPSAAPEPSVKASERVRAQAGNNLYAQEEAGRSSGGVGSWTKNPPARLRTGAKCRRVGTDKVMEIQDISMGRYTCMDPLTHKFLGDFKIDDLEFPM